MTQRTVLIVGAGHAGFKVAASLRQHGFAERICLINDEAHLPYQRPPLSKAYLKGEGRPDSLMFRPDKFYREQNIELIADRAASIDRAARRLSLTSGSSRDYGQLVPATGAPHRLLDGRHVAADLVVVGVGVLPNVELAAEAGLPVASGIIVNEQLLTSDPNISAIGDCALFASPRFGASLRLESVQNATDHARCVAARLTGDAKTYDGLPWFWSDQGDDKLQIAGLTTGYDRVVVRGDRGQRSFSAFCYKSGQLVGIESINRASDHVFGRRALAMNRSIEPEQAADTGFDLKAALARVD